MGWVLLAIAIAGTAAALGVAARALLNRRRIVRRTDAFPCRLRVTSGSVPGVSSQHWSPRVHYGYWMHDVLVLRSGPGLGRTRLLPVSCARGFVRPRAVAEAAGFGLRVVGLVFVLDDESTVDVAVPISAREQLPGPFLLAALDDARFRATIPPGEPDA